MAETTYSRAFWEKALELASKAPKQCEGCHTFTRLKVPDRRTVRLVCTEPEKLTPQSLHLLCTACHPDKTIKLPSKKMILAKIAELPFENPEAPKGAHA